MAINYDKFTLCKSCTMKNVNKNNVLPIILSEN